MRLLPKPLVKMPRYVAFRKGKKAMAKQFKSALKRLRDNGKLTQILQSWKPGSVQKAIERKPGKAKVGEKAQLTH